MGGWNSMTGLWKVSLVDMCLLRTQNIWSLSALYTRIRSTIFFSDCIVGMREEGERERGTGDEGVGERRVESEKRGSKKLGEEGGVREEGEG